MAITRKLPALPNQSTPLYDDKGRMTDIWYRFFREMMATLDEMRAAL